MATQIKKIREAVCANRGGLSDATDSQIMTIWKSLPADVQKQYLESIKGRKESDAPGDKTKSKV